MNNQQRLVFACQFAAVRHSKQRRKDVDATPYINHPIEVMNILANEGQVNDVDVLIAAVLHDVIEDTKTKIEEVASLFGERVASIVLEVTDDKKLSAPVRKVLQIETAPHLSAGATMVKLADKISNMRDLLINLPVGWSQDRIDEYFQWSAKVVSNLSHRSTLPELMDAYNRIQYHKLET